MLLVLIITICILDSLLPYLVYITDILFLISGEVLSLYLILTSSTSLGSFLPQLKIYKTLGVNKKSYQECRNVCYELYCILSYLLLALIGRWLSDKVWGLEFFNWLLLYLLLLMKIFYWHWVDFSLKLQPQLQMNLAHSFSNYYFNAFYI